MPLGYPPLTCRWPKPSDHREGQKLFVKVAGLSRLSRLPLLRSASDGPPRGMVAIAAVLPRAPFGGRSPRYACRVQVSQCPRRPRDSLLYRGRQLFVYRSLPAVTPTLFALLPAPESHSSYRAPMSGSCWSGDVWTAACLIWLSKSFEPTAGLWGVPPGSHTHCGAGALPLVRSTLSKVLRKCKSFFLPTCKKILTCTEKSHRMGSLPSRRSTG